MTTEKTSKYDFLEAIAWARNLPEMGTVYTRAAEQLTKIGHDLDAIDFRREQALSEARLVMAKMEQQVSSLWTEDEIAAARGSTSVHQLVKQLVKRNQELEAALRQIQFDAITEKCGVCAGWDMSPDGETPNAHTRECPIGKLLAPEAKP